MHPSSRLSAEESMLAMEQSMLAMEQSRLALEQGQWALERSQLAMQQSQPSTAQSSGAARAGKVGKAPLNEGAPLRVRPSLRSAGPGGPPKTGGLWFVYAQGAAPLHQISGRIR